MEPIKVNGKWYGFQSKYVAKSAVNGLKSAGRAVASFFGF
jgi:hypothetical protein